MTHFLYTQRPPLFAEARLVWFAGKAPSAAPANTPTPVDAKVNTAPSTPDPRATFTAAKERMQIHGEHLKALQAKLKPIQTLKVRLEAGEKLTDKDLTPHGITDTGASGLVDDLDSAIAGLNEKIKPHQETVNKANIEIADSLKAIEASDPDDKSEATFMKVDAVMNDPNASMFQKFAAVLKAFAEIQAVLKGITTPAAAPGSAPGGKSGPEGDRNSPSGKKETVRTMMKEGNYAKVGLLKAAKDANVTALRPQKAAADGVLTLAKTTLVAEQGALTTAESDLATDKGNPAKMQTARDAKAKVSTAEAAVKAAQDAVTSATKDLATAETDAKMVKEVEESSKKDAEDFNQNKEILEAKLTNLADHPGLTPAQKTDLQSLKNVMNAQNAAVADNGIDVRIQIAAGRMPAFLEAMVKAGVDPKELSIGANGVVEDPDAFQKGMEQFIAKMTSAGEQKPAAPAAPAPPAAAL